MYALVFDLNEPYDEYDQIVHELEKVGFERVYGNMYINKKPKNGLVELFTAIDVLSEIQYFKDVLRDIKVFKVEDWSDFTDIVKHSKNK